MGDYGDALGNEVFTRARKDTEAIAELIESGGDPRPNFETVSDVCRYYARSRSDAEGRFRRYVYGDPIAKVKIGKLRRRHLQDWPERLENTPALVSRRKNGNREFRERAASSVNRDMAVLRAALSTVLQKGAPQTEAAWQEALKPTPNADGLSHWSALVQSTFLPRTHHLRKS